MEYIIRNAAIEDIGALEELERLCFSTPWTAEQLSSQMPDGEREFLTADCGGALVGYVGMMHVLDEGYISNVAVAPSARRQGIGSALIDELLNRAEALSLSFVTLEVRQGNEPAKALYEKHGFQAVGVRRNYYTQPKEDAVLMTKFLNRGAKA